MICHFFILAVYFLCDNVFHDVLSAHSIEESKMDYDVAVIGSGPAGLSAAIHLQRSNKNVVLIEKVAHPRFKYCGGLLTQPAMAELRALGIDESAAYVSRQTTITIRYRDKATTIRTDQPFFLTNRRVLDNALYEIYRESGAMTILNDPVVIIQDNHTLTLRSHRCVTSDYLIGADGANSITRAYISGKKNNRQRLCIGRVFEEQVPEHLPTGLTLFLGLEETGYAWCFNADYSYCSIGIGGDFKIEDALVAYTRFTELLKVEPDSRKGFFLPYRHDLHRLAKDNILLAGDAAALLDPLFGEGVYQALYSGRMAAETIINNKPVSAYEQTLRPIIDIYEAGEKAKNLLSNAILRNWIYKNMVMHPGFLAYCSEKIVLTKEFLFTDVPSLTFKYKREKKTQKRA